MFKPTGALMRGVSSPKVIMDALHAQATNPNFEEIHKLNLKIYGCKHSIALFTEYIRFNKGNKTKWIKLIDMNEGMVKECQIRIALLGG